MYLCKYKHQLLHVVCTRARTCRALLCRSKFGRPRARANECVRAYLAGERQRGRHLLHGQVADARAQRAAARRAAAQLLAALVAHQVARLALQDGRQHVVEAYRALEQRRELRGLPGQAEREGGGRGGGPRHGHGAQPGGHGRRRGAASGSAVLSSARCFPGTESSASGRGRAAHGFQLRSVSRELPSGR